MTVFILAWAQSEISIIDLRPSEEAVRAVTALGALKSTEQHLTAVEGFSVPRYWDCIRRLYVHLMSNEQDKKERYPYAIIVTLLASVSVCVWACMYIYIYMFVYNIIHM